MRRQPQVPRSFLAHAMASGLGASGLWLRRLLRAVARPQRRCLRVNLLKAQDDILERLRQAGWQLSPVPWCPEGFFVETGPNEDLGNSLPHLTGEIYFQEPTSMLPPEALVAALKSFKGAGRKKQRYLVLDLCAAPGSKTTQLAAKLGDSALIVANELDPVRASSLKANLLRAGATNCIVTSFDGVQVGKLAPATFDAVLVDAPCSAEGNVRKFPSALDDWASAGSGSMTRERRARLQEDLLRSAWDALKPGGCLVYSTCSVNFRENERVLRRVLDAVTEEQDLAPGAAQSLSIEALLGVQSHKGSGTFKVWPHEYDTEGFCLAAFRKAPEGSTSSSAKDTKSSAMEQRHSLASISASDSRKLRKLVKETLGCWPADDAPGKLVVKENKDGLWLVPDVSNALEPLLPFSQEPGTCLARRAEGGFTISNEAVLLVGSKAGGQGSTMSVEEWLALQSKTEGTVGAFNARLGAAASKGDVQKGIDVLQEMSSQRLNPDVRSITTLVKAHGVKGTAADALAAEELIRKAEQDGMALDARCYSALLFALARSGEATKAENWMDAMAKRNVSPDLACYTSLIHACSNAGQPERGAFWLDKAFKSGLPVGAKCYSALLGAYAKLEMGDKAEAAFEQMRATRVEPDILCCNSLLLACSRSGQADKAAGWLQTMRTEGSPDVISFNTVISAYGRVSNKPCAWHWLKELIADGLVPTARTFEALVATDVLEGNWQEVESAFAEMDKLGVARDLRTHALLFTAYANGQPPPVDAAKAAFSRLSQAAQQNELIQAAVARMW